MILYRWRGAARNFGDELNDLLWPALLPGFFDANPSALFLGIGSILDSRHGAGTRKVVAGAGYGGYEPRPALDPSWIVHWVRGPGTARALNLPADLALGDPAALLRHAGLAPAEPGDAIGFMPHFESLETGRWAEAAAEAGLTLIDPRGDPAQTLAAIGRCRLLLSEALHGVIVADALRIPWIALRPVAPVHRAKWRDWAASVDLPVAFRRLPASSLPERMAASGIARSHQGRRLLAGLRERLDAVDPAGFLARATTGLRRAAQAAPQLSSHRALDRSQSRMLERIEALRRNPFRGPSPDPVSWRGSLLHRYDGFAYHPGPTG